MDNDAVVDALNTLIETSKDGEYGFRTSAERATSPTLKQFLEARAQSCAEGAAELQSLVVRLGGDAADSGTAAGALHRGWVSLKDAVASRDDLSILEECERGEDVAKARYRKALETADLPSDVRDVVTRQFAGVEKNHDDVRDLRDSHRQRKDIAG